MNVSPEEAQTALVTVQQTATKTRQALGFIGYYLIVWGLVWCFGFLASYLALPIWPDGVWAALFALGGVASLLLGFYQKRRGTMLRTSLSPRNRWFIGALVGYGYLWWVILAPHNATQGSLFVITFVMFAYVVGGIWLRKSLLVGTGLLVTGLAVLGYYLLPTFFLLWAALLCGGALVGSGVYAVLRWREPWQFSTR
jgi:hypothetical protein